MTLDTHFKNELKTELRDEILAVLLPRFDRIDKGFDDVDKRFDDVDKRFDGVDKRLDGVDKRLDGVDKRLDGVDKRFDGVDKRFDGVDKRFDDVDKRFVGIVDNLNLVATQCADNGKAIAKIGEKIDRYYEFERDVLVHEKSFKKQNHRIEVVESKLEAVIQAIKRNNKPRTPSRHK